MTSKTTAIPLELLAPARNADIAIAAITAGADAVYMGASSHGARYAASNSIDDVARVVDYAHRFRAKVFATVNTIVYDRELLEVERLIHSLYRVGVDALIVQDMSVLRMDIPPIELHASTQCDIRDVAKARFLANVGFSRIVLARELSLAEIAEIHNALPEISLEAFIHGALCVSYSGDCRASYVTTNRSANRGECAQICRLPYDLIDGNGRQIVEGRHLLSLRDLNRSDVIPDLIAAGVSSFKIEGRLKDESYVKNAVGAYSRILDRFVAESEGRYVRQSTGMVNLDFSPSLNKGFNRGFTSYFLSGKAPAEGMASLLSPKAVGQKVGVVKKSMDKFLTARLNEALANGDGLGYFTPLGIFQGFRLNRVEGDKLFPATPQSIPSGTVLYRNRDKEFDDSIAKAKTSRRLAVEMTLRQVSGNRIALEMVDEQGCSATVTAELPSVQRAKTPQAESRKHILEKLGGTLYYPSRIVDLTSDLFIPASVLAELRRNCVAALDRASRITYAYGNRLPEMFDVKLPQGERLTVHDNVANRLAREFYRSHGASEITSAIETAKSGEISADEPVMTTRYCLRRELGKCLKESSGKDWREPLTLVSGAVRLQLEFDCRNCRMNVYCRK